MSIDILRSRLRQLLACDMNARDIYKDLAANVDDLPLRREFEKLTAEEAGHVGLILSLLEDLQ